MTAIEKFTFALSFDDADNVIRSAGDDDEHYELGKKKKKKKDDTPPPPPAARRRQRAGCRPSDGLTPGRPSASGQPDLHLRIVVSPSAPGR